jgi:hypothetical protein
MVYVTVKFKNDSESKRIFKTWDDAYRFANKNISYTNDTRTGVARVSMFDDWGERAVWDSNWDDESKRQGLKMPA